MVLVTHSMDMACELCNRGIWISNGEVKKDGPCREVADEYLKETE